MSKKNLLVLTDRGFYCPAGDFYIDPHRGVDYAVITHAHSDHARPGSGNYLSTRQTAILLQSRLGGKISVQGVSYGEKFTRNGVALSFHPAGHIPGSAQVRVEYRGEIWVITGDYKIEDDGLSEKFEPVPCHTFVTETTFGLPIYHWREQEVVFNEINEWWKINKANKRTSIIYAYSLGKAQRILNGLDHEIGEVFAAPQIVEMNMACERGGYKLMPYKHVENLTSESAKGALVITPQFSNRDRFVQNFFDPAEAEVSGWMQINKMRNRNKNTSCFTISDHADWHGLLEAVKMTCAEKVYTMHGYTNQFARYLRETGIDADEISVLKN